MKKTVKKRISLVAGFLLLAGLTTVLVLPLFSRSFGWMRFQEESTEKTEKAKETEPPEKLSKKIKKRIRKELKENRKMYREKLPDSYRFSTAFPYLVISNLPEDKHNYYTNDTILPAHRAFYKMHMKQKPTHAITVFLFKAEPSYRKWARKLFGDKRVSHFGYYKSSNRTLVMNISTGGGTLVHEMTHALMEFDFPNAPSWFNEGMGSLYEQCDITKNGITGFVNWRLPGLKKGIRSGNLVDLESLLSTSTREFYGNNADLHYAEARYLMLYLQQQEKLTAFYRKFRANHGSDPTGKKTLREITGKSLKSLQKEWVKWVKTLRR